MRALPDSRIATHSRKSSVEHLRKVQRQYIKLFEDNSARADQLALSFPKDADDRETLNRLGAMGYRKPLEVSATVRHWLTGSYPSLRGEFARSQFTELVPVLLDRLARAENPDAALNAFDLFIGGLKRGARLFSLLKQNPDLVTLVALTLGTAPRLADILARYPEAMDALLEPTFFGALPDEAKLEAELAAHHQGGAAATRISSTGCGMFSQEQMFLIGARVLSDTVSAEQAGGAFARLADVAVRALHRRVEETVAENHGRIRRPADRAACARQAWRPRDDGDVRSRSHHRLRFRSEHPQSDGARPLYGAQYFARLTQRLISALSSQTNYGALYQVDMRLRPSGRSGPVATSLDAFAELPGHRSLDLGAHGADARARGLRRRRRSPPASRR